MYHFTTRLAYTRYVKLFDARRPQLISDKFTHIPTPLDAGRFAHMQQTAVLRIL